MGINDANGFVRPPVTAMEESEMRARHRAVGPPHLRAITENGYVPDLSSAQQTHPEAGTGVRNLKRDRPDDFE